MPFCCYPDCDIEFFPTNRQNETNPQLKALLITNKYCLKHSVQIAYYGYPKNKETN
jgi:hypothetical protein